MLVLFENQRASRFPTDFPVLNGWQHPVILIVFVKLLMQVLATGNLLFCLPSKLQPLFRFHALLVSDDLSLLNLSQEVQLAFMLLKFPMMLLKLFFHQLSLLSGLQFDLRFHFPKLFLLVQFSKPPVKIHMFRTVHSDSIADGRPYPFTTVRRAILRRLEGLLCLEF